MDKQMPIGLCPHCGGIVYRETDPELKDEYTGVCNDCDENFYEFEIL
ncbi:MAG: hypothetical protein NC035_08925 [Bacteroides sp.]|nr:hypothetical protein [Bacteroides sp.]